MKQPASLVIALGILLCLNLSACNDDEETVVPNMKRPAKQEATTAPDSEPTLQPIQTLAASTSPAPSSAAARVSQPGETGNYTLQVGIQPSRKGAEGILQKLESSGIQGYLAQVENPGELEGTYYRIRIGFFRTLPEAQAYGKNALEPLGFAWWVDNRANDAIGSPEHPEEASYEDDANSTDEPEASAVSTSSSTSNVQNLEQNNATPSNEPSAEEESTQKDINPAAVADTEAQTSAPADTEVMAPPPPSVETTPEAPQEEPPAETSADAPSDQDQGTAETAPAAPAPEESQPSSDANYDDWE